MILFQHQHQKRCPKLLLRYRKRIYQKSNLTKQQIKIGATSSAFCVCACVGRGDYFRFIIRPILVRITPSPPPPCQSANGANVHLQLLQQQQQQCIALRISWSSTMRTQRNSSDVNVNNMVVVAMAGSSSSSSIHRPSTN